MVSALDIILIFSLFYHVATYMIVILCYNYVFLIFYTQHYFPLYSGCLQVFTLWWRSVIAFTTTGNEECIPPADHLQVKTCNSKLICKFLHKSVVIG